MKNIVSLVLVSVLGGAITLGTYKTFLEQEQTITYKEEKPQTHFLQASNSAPALLNNLDSTNFVEAAEKTVHTVVHVKNITLSNEQPSFEDLFFGRIPQKPQVGTGSGVIISPDGYIITNNHVINESQKLQVTLNNNKTYDAEIVGTDEKTDIALLKIESSEELPFTTFGDSDQAKIGEWVLAVGNPFNLTSTVTAGIISAKSRDLSGTSSQSFIQTDAAVNPGNSGGALVNSRGDLIGINTAITSQTGSYIGYSFAVPSNIAKKVVRDIMEFGNVQNGILGVRGGSLNSNSAEKFGITDTEGFYVDDVEEDTGAAQAGIKSGDIIKMIDHIKIRKFSDLRGYLDTKSPNDVVNLSIIRNGDSKVVPVKLLKNQTLTIPFIGTVKNAKTKDLKKHKTKKGVKIQRLTNNPYYLKYWQNNGTQEGDIITAINDIEVNSVDDVKKIIKNKTESEPLKIELINAQGEKERHYFR